MRIAAMVPVAVFALLAGAGQATAEDTGDSFHIVTASGQFGAYRPDATAVTYRPELVPEGAHVRVFSLSAPTPGTTVALAVRGLEPGHRYGAHVHTKPCGATGDAAGPHYQHLPDPVSPSVDPAYANPHNEIWLDFTASPLGTGLARSRVDWQFTADRRASSVVLHETHTHTDPGHAGTAGARLACVNVSF
ncbi:superoxide dismutase family protein [Amycolatopsis nigrescens]|uniref:superoxide dismutase family protein n=1 Tax=Amycolatopsis nigrescens TaxID=381445 RepID=UPI000477F85C|nr:superoxide dismutase family protein [Amycolatopsis nigrescens]